MTHSGCLSCRWRLLEGYRCQRLRRLLLTEGQRRRMASGCQGFGWHLVGDEGVACAADALRQRHRAIRGPVADVPSTKPGEHQLSVWVGHVTLQHTTLKISSSASHVKRSHGRTIILAHWAAASPSTSGGPSRRLSEADAYSRDPVLQGELHEVVLPVALAVRQWRRRGGGALRSRVEASPQDSSSCRGRSVPGQHIRRVRSTVSTISCEAAGSSANPPNLRRQQDMSGALHMHRL